MLLRTSMEVASSDTDQATVVEVVISSIAESLAKLIAVGQSRYLQPSA